MDNMLIIVGVAAYAGAVVTRKAGPWGVFEKLRTLGKPFTCSACMAFWTALVTVALLWLWPALAILLAAPAAAGYALGIMALCGVVDLD